MAYNFQLGVTYNFDVWPTSAMQANFRNVKIVGIMTGAQAAKELDVVAAHQEFYPTLPVGTPNFYDGYNYIKIEFPSKDTTILGIAWIKENTIQVVNNITKTIRILNFDASREADLIAMLVQNNFPQFEILPD